MNREPYIKRSTWNMYNMISFTCRSALSVWPIWKSFSVDVRIHFSKMALRLEYTQTDSPGEPMSVSCYYCNCNAPTESNLTQKYVQRIKSYQRVRYKQTKLSQIYVFLETLETRKYSKSSTRSTYLIKKSLR